MSQLEPLLRHRSVEMLCSRTRLASSVQSRSSPLAFLYRPSTYCAVIHRRRNNISRSFHESSTRPNEDDDSSSPNSTPQPVLDLRSLASRPLPSGGNAPKIQRPQVIRRPAQLRTGVMQRLPTGSEGRPLGGRFRSPDSDRGLGPGRRRRRDNDRERKKKKESEDAQMTPLEQANLLDEMDRLASEQEIAESFQKIPFQPEEYGANARDLMAFGPGLPLSSNSERRAWRAVERGIVALTGTPVPHALNSLRGTMKAAAEKPETHVVFATGAQREQATERILTQQLHETRLTQLETDLQDKDKPASIPLKRMVGIDPVVKTQLEQREVDGLYPALLDEKVAPRLREALRVIRKNGSYSDASQSAFMKKIGLLIPANSVPPRASPPTSTRSATAS